jgi:hypothetical protein
MLQRRNSERCCISPGVVKTALWALMFFLVVGGIYLLCFSRLNWNWIAAQWWAWGVTVLFGTIMQTAYCRWYWEFQCDTEGIHQHGKTIRWSELIYIRRFPLLGVVCWADAKPGLLKRVGIFAPGGAISLPPPWLLPPRSRAHDIIHTHAPIGHPLTEHFCVDQRDATQAPHGTME